MSVLQVIELFWAECYCQDHGLEFRPPAQQKDEEQTNLKL
jgi:hypothetical protein